MLAELKKLNDFQAQESRIAQNLTQVNQANSITPVAASLARPAGAGGQVPGAVSANASMPNVIAQEDLNREGQTQVAEAAQAKTTGGQNVGGQTAQTTNQQQTEAEQTVAWSLLGEAGIGGPLGRLKQTQYAVSKNLGAAQGIAGWAGNQLSNNSGISGMSPSSWTAAVPTAASSVVGALQNHELATSVGVMALSEAGNKFQDWFEQGAAMGYGTGQYGALLGGGRALTNASTTQEGEAYDTLIQSLRFGGAAGARKGQGLTKAYAQDLVGQLFEQGYSLQPGSLAAGGFGATGNAAAIAQGLSPAVMAMGQQGAQIAGTWTAGLRSANDSLSDLTQMLEQIPAAAKASQLGLEGFNQAMQLVAQTVTSMGGTSTEGARMSLQFTQQYGLNPQDQASLLQNPIYQAYGLAQGVLPSGLGAMSGGQTNQLTQQTLQLYYNAFKQLAPAQTYTTLANGTQIPSNTPDAYIYQQIASQIPGMTAQDIKVALDPKTKQHQSVVSAIQNQLGQTNVGEATNLEYLTGGSDPNQWKKLSTKQQGEATQYWNQKIQPLVAQAGLTPAQLKAINSTGNIAQRAKLLNADITPAANAANNPNTVQIQIGLKGKAAQVLTATASAKGAAKAIQNAGGTTLNVPLNSAIGQNPTYSSDNSGLTGSGAFGGNPFLTPASTTSTGQ